VCWSGIGRDPRRTTDGPSPEPPPWASSRCGAPHRRLRRLVLRHGLAPLPTAITPLAATC